MAVIPAAGTVPWRHVDGALEVALVHRPRYDDWSWPKGKLDPDEDSPAAATRETYEETGLRVHLGLPLPSADYTVLDRNGTPATKEVRYWAAQVVGGRGRFRHEVDDLAWLSVTDAFQRLDYSRDRDQLLAVVRADQERRLPTRPMAIVRHAKARSRSGWRGDDRRRPLDAAGKRRADAMVGLLAAYGIRRLVSSPSIRCADTFQPYAAVLHRPMRLRDVLSEEGFEAEPRGAPALTRSELRQPRPTAVCSHGPVLPAMLGVLAEHAAPDAPEACELLARVAEDGMDKGEVLVAHVTTDPEARVVAVERHLP